MEYSYQFTHAIVRQPAKSISEGLRAVDLGSPDYNQMILDHKDYVEALTFAGLEVISGVLWFRGSLAVDAQWNVGIPVSPSSK